MPLYIPVSPASFSSQMADDQNCVAELEEVDSSSEDGVDAKPDRSSVISSILWYVFFFATLITLRHVGLIHTCRLHPRVGRGHS